VQLAIGRPPAAPPPPLAPCCWTVLFKSVLASPSPVDRALTIPPDRAQPPLVSLFSSTSSHPTQLAKCTTASDTIADSFISLLQDASDDGETLVAWTGSSAAELSARADSLRRLRRGLPAGARDLDGQVLHLQAPDCRSTSVRWGSLSPRDWREDGLGVELPVVHFQLKHLEQTMYLEVAVVDERDEVTLVRCSTFQVRPLLPRQRSSKGVYGEAGSRRAGADLCYLLVDDA